MSDEQEVVLLLRGAIASCDAETQHKAKSAYDAIIELEKQYGDGAHLAIGLRGAELAAQA